ncbi:MAG: chitobiase/beta-hexosaminidase C-terminal domain-containing protein, partial [Deltaproteobacteria bacterium]|nr:chitobiase/beta-hexosaminidase C-terminal domain-containing protein [Deltaproteobacteria bacterium]
MRTNSSGFPWVIIVGAILWGLPGCTGGGGGGPTHTTPPLVSASPPGGSYGAPQAVALTADEEASIHYTVDGAEPTDASPTYSQPILIEHTSTLRFFGVDKAGNRSATREETYDIDATPPQVQASPPGGTIRPGTSVALTADEPSTVFYTTDGTGPSSNSLVYSKPVPMTQTTTLKFFAEDTAGNDSPTQEEVYVIDSTIPRVQPSPRGGTFQPGISIVLTTNEPATIHYTTDGTPASAASPVYSGPLSLDRTTVLCFVACDEAGNQSQNQTERYVIDAVAPTVTPSLPGGTYGIWQTVALKANEPAVVFYTVDGTAPSLYSPVYSQPLRIAQTTTLTFFAEDAAGNRSQTREEVYVIDRTAPRVQASPPSGTFRPGVAVTLTADEPSVIHYTTNGTPATAASPVYSSPITLDRTTTLSFVAIDVVGNQSQMRTETYVIDAVVPIVAASLPAGTYGFTQTVALTTDKPAIVFFTADGTEPSRNSSIYSGPLSISRTTTLKYFAEDAVGNRSAIQTLQYVIDLDVTAVDGYMDRLSYNPGEQATVYVNAARETHGWLRLYDTIGNEVFAVEAIAVPQAMQPDIPWEKGFGYAPTATIRVPDLRSDVYLWDNKIPFLIKTGSRRASILVLYPSNTLTAYNTMGGRSFYTSDKASTGSFLRPLPEPMSNFIRPFIEWLTSYRKYDIGYMSDLDMENYDEINSADLIIAIGHSEYWTRQARSNLDLFVDSGKPVLILSGNTMWWQVRYSEDKTQLICYKNRALDPIQDPLLKTINWNDPSLNYSIMGSIGGDFPHGGYGMQYHTSERGWDGFKVVDPASPAFGGLNLPKGYVISMPSLEYDGTLLS